MQCVLIIQTAFLGDVILATPLIESFKETYPQIEIDFLVKKGNESLLENNPNLRQVYTFDKSTKWSSILSLSRTFRRNNYDLTVNLQRFTSSGIITFLSGAKLTVGFQQNPFSFLFSKKIKHEIGNGTHEVDRNLKLIAEWIKTPIRQPKLYPSTSDFEAIQSYQTESYCCLAPSSVWFTKEAPLSYWQDLAKELTVRNFKVILLGAPNEIERSKAIETVIPKESVINLTGKLSLLQSAALMKNARMNFVNDSGPMHLCSSMNAPTTVFFCSTVPAFGFGPLSDDAKIIEVKDLGCRPCGLHGFKSCPKEHFNCGKRLPKVDLIHL
ncbi:MAG: hypothetical protein RL264_1351 [Bacteroidota bacterium]|jgi:heptosyltransferase-2